MLHVYQTSELFYLSPTEFKSVRSTNDGAECRNHYNVCVGDHIGNTQLLPPSLTSLEIPTLMEPIAVATDSDGEEGSRGWRSLPELRRLVINQTRWSNMPAKTMEREISSPFPQSIEASHKVLFFDAELEP